MLLLILRLEGPLMRWGLHSLWNERDTHIVPTKSGIVGLISCALGISRGDKKIEEISNSIKIGVRADRGGTFLRDLQIVSENSNYTIKNLHAANYKPRVGAGSLLTYRHYLQDASFTVAIMSQDRELLERMAKALKAPVFPVYLGAKNCVASRPIFDSLTKEYSTIEEALEKHPISPMRESDKKSQNYYCEIEKKQGKNIRQDEIKINEMREFAFRRVTIKYVGG